MNLALWIAQGLLGLAMFAAGSTKVAVPRARLLKTMGWAESWSDGRFKLLGLAEVFGAIGLVVPWLTGIAPLLTPIAALCLLVLMGGAVKTHIDRKEPPVPPAVLAALALFIALGRSGLL
jgi:hypothetical protein